MTVHSFTNSLNESHEYADAPWWELVYRAAFPNFAGMVSVRQDGWAQRGGIDRRVCLSDGTTLTVDEKVRKRDWPDFLLEHWSDWERRKPGWINKDLTCDYLAYAFVPSQTCYLLPFQTLQRAWRKYGPAWWERYEIKRAKNRENKREWLTVSVAVPIPVVLEALGEAMTISWATESEAA